MSWFTYLHHLALHFPIVLTMVLAAVGLWSLKHPTSELRKVIFVMGWVAWGLTTVATISGVVAAPGWFGGDGTVDLAEHRNMGVTAWSVISVAHFGYHMGYRQNESDWMAFGILVWCVAVLAVVGAGHWGGSTLHPDRLPF